MKVPDIPPWLLFVSIVLGLAVSVLAFLGYLKSAWKWCWEWLEKPIGARRRPRHVNLSITQDYASTVWQEGGRGGVPHMLVVCTLHVTNTGPARVAQIVDAYIKQPLTRPANYIDPQVFYALGYARTVVFNFEIAPPVAQSGRSWVADVVLVDQFGGEHTVEDVTFATYGAQVWAGTTQPG